MKYVTIEEIISIHKKLIDRYGGTIEIRDYGLLNLSVSNVFQTYDGDELYPSDIDKIIQLSYSLIKNHCFVDGNKRIGVMMLVYLFEINSIRHNITNEDLIKIGLDIASGEMSRENLKKLVLSKIHKS